MSGVQALWISSEVTAFYVWVRLHINKKIEDQMITFPCCHCTRNPFLGILNKMFICCVALIFECSCSCRCRSLDISNDRIWLQKKTKKTVFFALNLPRWNLLLGTDNLQNTVIILRDLCRFCILCALRSFHGSFFSSFAHFHSGEILHVKRHERHHV